MIEVKDKELFSLFPTTVYRGFIDDEQFLDELKDNVLDLKSKGVGEYEFKDLNFETPDDLHERPEFQKLVELVLRESDAIFNQWNLIRESHYVTTMWATTTNPNYTHQLHNHPNCLLSGLIYLNVPENCGKLFFRDPRSATTTLNYNYKEYNNFNSRTHYFKPKKGSILFWPHWLDHAVERGTYEGEEYRIMIAFNIMVKADIKIKTSKLRI